jgi:hypothetical protein
VSYKFSLLLSIFVFSTWFYLSYLVIYKCLLSISVSVYVILYLVLPFLYFSQYRMCELLLLSHVFFSNWFYESCSFLFSSSFRSVIFLSLFISISVLFLFFPPFQLSQSLFFWFSASNFQLINWNLQRTNMDFDNFGTKRMLKKRNSFHWNKLSV